MNDALAHDVQQSRLARRRRLAYWLATADAFRSLVDALPDPTAIALLKEWGRGRGLYPLDEDRSPSTPDEAR